MSYPAFDRSRLKPKPLWGVVRTVLDEGESFNIQGDHRETVPNLYRLIMKRLVEE